MGKQTKRDADEPDYYAMGYDKGRAFLGPDFWNIPWDDGVNVARLLFLRGWCDGYEGRRKSDLQAAAIAKLARTQEARHIREGRQ